MQTDEFESRLRQDLPRGHALRPSSAGRERALFARWLTPAEMTGQQWRHEGGLLFGRREGRFIGWNDDRHVMTIAGSRAGKGVSLIAPNLEDRRALSIQRKKCSKVKIISKYSSQFFSRKRREKKPLRSVVRVPPSCIVVLRSSFASCASISSIHAS
jgi:hypothetical protein